MTPRKQLEDLRGKYSRHWRFNVHQTETGGCRPWNQPDTGLRMSWRTAKRHARREMTLFIDVINPERTMRDPLITVLKVKLS